MPKKLLNLSIWILDILIKLGFQAEGYEGSELDYDREFKKRNYYNIPDFKQVSEDTRYGGTWYPGMPEWKTNFSNSLID